MIPLPPELLDPPREYTLFPFWFWNDDLDEAEIIRQMEDFAAHGVYGFVIHPRVGLPRSIGWMSERMLTLVRFAVEAAAKRDMRVILYDEGMYPSGSSSGQVVAENPAFQCRCLAKVALVHSEPLALPAGQTLVARFDRADGSAVVVIDRPLDACIRGLHYVDEETAQEDEPPAADLLNPDAVDCFLRLVYDRYAAALSDHFGTTILGIFTDEPSLLGRPRERGVAPGTTGILEKVSAFLGSDFTPRLLDLWEDSPEGEACRADYDRALTHCLEESYYSRLSAWCRAHGIALAGHPSHPDALGLMRYFDIPGQDLVWRWVLPGQPSALEGPESTQAKCSSSAMVHTGRRRNSNECFGAYGHGFTEQEMKWLVDWCFVRGVNLLYPHAFYYSVRGPRKDERPPDVGPNSPRWDGYAAFAAYCRRMAWINTGGRHACKVAILGESFHLPWQAAKICFQRQLDFNYLEFRHLWQDAAASADGVRIREMHYPVVVLDGYERVPAGAVEALTLLARHGRLVLWNTAPARLVEAGAISPKTEAELSASLLGYAQGAVFLDSSQPDLRIRHVIKAGLHYFLLANEGLEPIRPRVRLSLPGEALLFDPFTAQSAPLPEEIDLPPFTLKVIVAAEDRQ